MKILCSTLLTIFLTCTVHAVTATQELNPQLRKLFEQMQGAEANALEQREFEVNLTVKIFTERFLIFSDAYLQAGKDTKYQIGKWSFPAGQFADLQAEQGDVLTVRFRIDAIRTQAPYAGMPHFTATILSMVPFQP